MLSKRADYSNRSYTCLDRSTRTPMVRTYYNDRSRHTSLASAALLTVVGFSGILGVGSDSVRANSYYHWGALHALVAIAEERAYPSPMLGGKACQ